MDFLGVSETHEVVSPLIKKGKAVNNLMPQTTHKGSCKLIILVHYYHDMWENSHIG